MNKKPTPTQLILYGSLSAIILLIVIMATTKPNGKELPESKEAAVPVLTLSAHLASTADIVYLPAMLEANVNATLSAEKAGRIVELKVDRGDPVEKGQILLQIDDRIWQASLKQATIAAENAETNFGRFKKLQADGAVAESEYDNIRQTYIQAEAMATEANINIELCRVESPITGVVNDRFVETGEYVQPGTPVFQIVDHATVKVMIQVPEKDIYSIKAGDEISFSVQPLPDRTFTGKVSFVAAQADERNNAFRAELAVDNTDGTLRPGMIAQVEFHRGITDGMISLPMSAVLPSKGDHIVYLAKEGHAVRRKVQIETITRERALISSGLEEGDQIIVEGSRTLSDGQLVEIMNTETAQ